MKKLHKRILIGGIVIIVLALLVWGISRFIADPKDDRAPVPGSYTMADVAAARTTLKCWAAIDGSVYDLTSFASKDSSLLSLCGTDATDAVSRAGQGGAEPFTSLRIGSLNK